MTLQEFGINQAKNIYNAKFSSALNSEFSFSTVFTRKKREWIF
jgi:hypothetical protein